MKIIFISNYYYPHIGGVEKHVEKIAEKLGGLGNDIEIITGKYNEQLLNQEKKGKVTIHRIYYPQIKYLGLLRIWYELWKLRDKLKDSDVVHIHDVFIWYLPFRFIFFKKPVYVTFHGWEGVYPIPFWNKLSKKLASVFSEKNISVGKYIDKYYGIKSDEIIYGGVDKLIKIKNKKEKNTIVFFGRLEIDTGLLEFLEWFSVHGKKMKLIFLGDGTLKNKCEKYGRVVGFVRDVDNYLKNTEYCVPSGYLSYFEALNNNCKIKTFSENYLKYDYWNNIKQVRSIPTWDDVVKVYLKLWKR